MRLLTMVCVLVLLGFTNCKPRTYLVETKDRRGGGQEFGNDYMDEELYDEEYGGEGIEGDDYGLPPPTEAPTPTPFIPDYVSSAYIGEPTLNPDELDPDFWPRPGHGK